MENITQERLKDLVHYDPITGQFTWRVDSGVAVKAGNIIRCTRPDGYVRFQIDGVRRYASHWAFLYMTGRLPRREVDHKDRVRSNDAWDNLRECTKSENCANRATRRSAVGLRGVTPYGSRFKAQIRTRGETKYLGLFDSAEAAHRAYLAAASDAFGEFTQAT